MCEHPFGNEQETHHSKMTQNGEKISVIKVIVELQKESDQKIVGRRAREFVFYESAIPDEVLHFLNAKIEADDGS